MLRMEVRIVLLVCKSFFWPDVTTIISFKSNARRSFSDEVLDAKLQCCHVDTFFVSNGDNIAASNFARFVVNDIQD